MKLTASVFFYTVVRWYLDNNLDQTQHIIIFICDWSKFQWTYSLPLALLIATTLAMVSSASPVTSNDLSEDYEDLFYREGDRVFHRNSEDEEKWGEISEVDEPRHLVKRAPSPNLFPFKKFKKLAKLAPKKLALKKLPKLALKKLPKLALKKLPKLALKKLPLKKLGVKKLPLKKLGGTGFAATQIIPRGARLKKLSKFALPLGGAGSALPLGAAGFAATQIIPRGPSLPRPRFRNPFSG